MASAGTADEIRRSVLLRANELEIITGNLRGQLGPSRDSLHAALTLAGSLPNPMRDTVAHHMASTPDPNLRIQILTPLLRHLNYLLDFVESYLAHGTRRELSEALAEEIQDELTDLGVSDHRVVLSHGPANNFQTFCGDLGSVFFRPLTRLGGAPMPSAKFALFRVPRFEGAGVQWRPILLGHEVAHAAVTAKNAVAAFDLQNKLDPARAGTLINPGAAATAPPALIFQALYRIAESWTTELICDLQALKRFGPAAIASLAEYFECIGAGRVLSTTHPPGVLRIRLLLDHIGPVSDSRLNSIIAPWANLVPATVAFAEPWAQALADVFTANRSALETAAGLLGSTAYDFAARQQWIHDSADRFSNGFPGREIRTATGKLEESIRADTVNAAWLARVEGAITPFDRLAEKTNESIRFVNRWRANDGVVPNELHHRRTDTEAVLNDEAGHAVLSADALLQRMRLDDSDKGLVVTPALHLPGGSGLDLRLGTRFIVFRRTATASFDPLGEVDDPRAIQVFVELSLKERFVLHPGEVVLGSTLEYLAIPDDLSGQVITRSSYGRLGLLSATAVQVHPAFRGCLTLELVNLSNIPITLTPGERIAQLVLWKTKSVAASTKKYTHPIGPQFSMVREDGEADTLRKLRR